MEILIIAALIIAGLVFFAIEVFLIPGISLAGLASAASLIYAVYYAFANVSPTAGTVTLFISAFGVIGVIIWFMRSKTVDRLSLKKSIDYKPNPLEDIDLKIGDTGVSVTRLTLIGNAEFNGHIIEVQSADGFIDEHTPIKVIRIKDGTVYVQRTNN
ncbi:NfeD family protein [uncultured Bacteroides sp.]|uniref:NfeD family protein n=1 Tax=uncultured Bacteroides sp. TaxID=162156 RepID=UPI0026053024|nr:NfeD family protein [uncultured Bacteroides sp.]